MKKIEIEGNVNKQGQLIIPAHFLSGIGLVPGDAVKIACMNGASGHTYNTFSELSIDPAGITALEKIAMEEKEIFLPNELLEAADIPLDSDIEIVCIEGAIVIMEADLLDMIPDELRQLFDELNINPETVRSVIRNGGVMDEQ